MKKSKNYFYGKIKPITIAYNQKVFVTSDTHFNHKNICSGVSEWTDKTKCRNFETIFEMNETLINGINSLISSDDLLFHLVDFSFGGEGSIPEFRAKINCKNIILIKGNHDQHIHKYKNLFIDMKEIGFYNYLDTNFVLCHYPMMHWQNQKKGSIMLHGHLHGFESDILKTMHDNCKIMDVGVDTNNYYPYNLTDLIAKFEKK